MNPLQRAAATRKAIYLGAILALFTVSMFWRGALPVPLAAGPLRWAAAHTIQSQARTLEVSELDEREGEVELAGSTARLMLTGSRGLVVTGLWLSAIEKQKRNDFHEFEDRVRKVTKLQPNFITPWIFQSWNIAYNVSVEMHGSGDMFFYIVRGIQLLAEGERRNKRSPDMRYQIAFYYQNKFGVSDQVEVLRCLFDLSCIPPSKRRAEDFYVVRQEDGSRRFDHARFQEFCERFPHLVRRLRGEEQLYSDKRAKEKLRREAPADVVDFLRVNWEVPSRYRLSFDKKPTDDLAEADAQFPALPPQFNEGPDEAHPGLATPDDKAPGIGYFSAFKAARAWFSYSLLLLPDNYKDAQGIPVPGPAPAPGTRDPSDPTKLLNDPAKHRVPRLPMLIIFRQGAPRAQTYQADMEQKEGWFDADGWRIDDPKDQPKKWWFPDDPDRPTRAREVVVGAGRTWSLDEWRRAAELWDRHGKDYALAFPPGRKETLENRVGNPNTVPEEMSPEQMEADPAMRERFLAKLGLRYYGTNRSVTNFPYFVAAAQAESQPRTVQARKTLWQADQARKVGRTDDAIRLYKTGLDLWKQVLGAKENEGFLRPERSERTEEETFEYELAYLRLLVQGDERVRERANTEFRKGLHLIPFAKPGVPFPEDDYRKWRHLVPFHPAGTPAPDPLWTPANREEIKWWVVENVSDADFSSPFTGTLAPDRQPWVSESTKESVRVRLNVRSRQQPPQPGGPPTAPTPATATP